MLGLDIFWHFFSELVWWQMIVFVMIFVWSIIAMERESGIGILIPLAIFTWLPWEGVGIFWNSLSIIENIYVILIYLGIGIVWGIYKWRLLVLKIVQKKEYRKLSREQLKDEINSNKDYDIISFWMLFWPLSFTGYFIGDLIITLFRNFSKSFGKIFDLVTESILDSVN